MQATVGLPNKIQAAETETPDSNTKKLATLMQHFQ